MLIRRANSYRRLSRVSRAALCVSGIELYNIYRLAFYSTNEDIFLCVSESFLVIVTSYAILKRHPF